MGQQRHDFESDAAASLLRWWSDAGVDTAVGEQPYRWLGPVAVGKPSRAPVVAERPALGLPSDLGGFREWFVTADLPDAGPPRSRIAPVGDPTSGLMILTDVPDNGDAESGFLMSGELDGLFTAMLAALGRTRGSVYLTSLCPGRPPAGWISDEHFATYRGIARHHVRLVAPRQLWLVGPAPSRAILGLSEARASGQLHDVNLEGITIEAIVTAHPRSLKSSKVKKAAAWAEMQRLMKKDNA